jgi:streptogramin lyase
MKGVLGAAALASTLLAVFPAAARAHPGTGIAVDARGRVYFTDLRRIWLCEPDGRLTVVVSGKHSHAIRLDEEGRLEGEHLAYEPGSGRWWTSSWRLEPDGTVHDTPPPTEGFPFLFTPAVGPDGTRYYTRVDNNRRDVSEIHRRRSDGRAELVAGGAYGFADGLGREARFGPIGAIAVGPGGALFVTDEVSIRKIDPSGRVTTIARGGPLLKPSLFSRFFQGRFGKLMGLVVDGEGTVFAANYGGRRVVRIASSGRVSSVLESDDGWSPSGVALARGVLYVLEAGHGDAVRVRRLPPGGRPVLLASVRGGKSVSGPP